MLSIHMGPCAECGVDTELFLGRQFCDACIARLVADRERIAAIEVAAERLSLAVKRGALSPECREVSWSSSDQTPELDAVRAWASGEGMSALWLWSSVPGTGKTHAARCALRAACESGVDAAESPMRQAIRLGTSNYSNARDDFEALSRRALLLLDDADKVHPTPQGLEALWELIDDRRSRRLRTILTANCDPAAWVNGLGGGALAHSMADRLKPMVLVEFSGASRR